MGKGRVTSIRIDEDVLERAKELGLNISKIAENALREAIKRLKGEYLNNDPEANSVDETNAGPRGLEPPTSGSEGRRSVLAELRALVYTVYSKLY